MDIEMWKAQVESGTIEEKREAIRVAKDFPIEQVIDVLVRLLYDPNKAIQEAVIEFLSSESSAIVVKKLLPLLREENAAVRNAAIEILEKIGRDKVDLIGEYLNDEDKDVRLFVCDILGKFGTDKTLEYLKKAINDSDVNVRNSAVMGIGRIKNEKAVEVLADLIGRENDTWVRFSIIDALSQIGGEKAKQVLRAALFKEENEVVMKALLEAIARFGDENFVYDALYVFEFLLTRKLSDIFADIVELGLRAEKIENKCLSYKFAVYLCAFIKYAEDRWMAYRAVNVVPKLQDCAEDVLIEVMQVVDEPMILSSILETLKDIGTDKCRAAVERCLDASDERIVELAREVLQKLGG